MARDYRYVFWHDRDIEDGVLFFRDDYKRTFSTKSWSGWRKNIWFFKKIEEIPSLMFNKINGVVCQDGKLIESYLKG